MKLVETLVVRDEQGDVLTAHIAFHLAAGVDAVLLAAAGDVTVPELDPRVQVERFHAAEDPRTRLARKASTELGADWVLLAEPRDFWWPRGETLKDALDAIPVRYGAVQGLVREFAPASEGWVPHRRAASPGGRPLEQALRPLLRAAPDLDVEDVASRDRVPLRAWYPFEVLRVPRSSDPEPAGELVEDIRLRDAFEALAGGESLALRVPDLVDDAAYAVDCAAVGEVDLPRLEREVAELEARVIWLEQRLWPRLLRRLKRVARR